MAILLVLTGIFWLGGFWFLFRLPLCKAGVLKMKYPGVTLIIPARNEEQNIGRLLDSVNSQRIKPDEIIVVNDNSTDRTKEISLKKKARVLDSSELPPGWLGKPWACLQGARHASEETLLFLDADTEFTANGYENLLDTFQQLSCRDRTAMSLSPYHAVKRFHEELSLMFNIIMTGSMNAFTPLKDAIPAGLFGPCLMVRKEDYFSVKGHEPVKDKILENVFIGDEFKKKGIRLKCFGGRHSLACRMYPESLNSLIRGWTKAFASGAGKTPHLLLLNIIAWISAGFIISIQLAFALFSQGSFLLWLVFYFLFAFQLSWMGARVGSFRILSFMFFPVHLLFFCMVFFLSLYFKLLGRAVDWKSRNITQ